MKIYVTSIMVDSQEKACQFYTEKLGFKVKHDVPVGEYRWLFEPYRVCRRVNILRDYPDDKIKIYP